MTHFASLTITQLDLMQTILHREMLDARRGRWKKAEAEEIEAMFNEVRARKREIEEKAG
jgi:hypothetical protein